MPQFHNEDIFNRDTVYDLEHGYGRVITMSESRMEVAFSTKTISYSYSGIARAKTAVTLFWDKPYIIPPTKDSGHWVGIKEKFDAILAIVNEHS